MILNSKTSFFSGRPVCLQWLRPNSSCMHCYTTKIPVKHTPNISNIDVDTVDTVYNIVFLTKTVVSLYGRCF